jgi:hypothetical protein
MMTVPEVPKTPLPEGSLPNAANAQRRHSERLLRLALRSTVTLLRNVAGATKFQISAPGGHSEFLLGLIVWPLAV